MRFSDDPRVNLETARSQLKKYLQQHSGGLSNLKLQLVDELKEGLFQVLFTWESSLNYWSPTFELAQVAQLQFGFGVLDYSVRKSIVCCHTQKERDEIAKVLATGFGVGFSSLVLTKPLLEQIGSFDSVKRALYVIGKVYLVERGTCRQTSEEEGRPGLSTTKKETCWSGPILPA